MMPVRRRPEAVLFDLDGTLADTAPDLVGTLLELRAELGLPGLDGRPLRAVASRGAPALLELGLPELDAGRRAALRERFVARYAARCWRDSRAFDGIEACLGAIERAGLGWGVVTNKLEWLAREVIVAAGWQARAGCLIGGDTLPRPKPAPDPVVEACRRLGVLPAHTAFIGDDRRDVAAGRAAGTATVVALWGYIAEGEDPLGWGADAAAESPGALYGLLGLAEAAGAAP